MKGVKVMRRNRIFSGVFRNGRVIRAAVDDEEPAPGPEPPGHAAVFGHMDAPRLAAFAILAFVCILLVLLAAAGIYRVGKWAFSGNGNTAITAAEKSGRRNSVETQFSQRPAFVPPADSYDDADSEVDEVSHTEPIDHQPTQSIGQRRIYRRQNQEQEKPAVVSDKPAVDYRASIREMEAALERKSLEMKRITTDLRDTGRSDENDW